MNRWIPATPTIYRAVTNLDDRDTLIKMRNSARKYVHQGKHKLAFLFMKQFRHYYKTVVCNEV